ncbi:MAG: LysR family transcriptional regulator [Rhodobacteraceae bacterium]|nr:MAG: LysR family transcriptional regulator [Paracoccaceae bacterium]
MSYLESLNVFVRVVELGSITAGGRDLRLTPAVASKRIKELEARLGVRLFNRTTRSLTVTEAGEAYFEYALRVIEALEASEAVIAGISGRPKGAIRVSAPLGIGRRLIAPHVPEFTRRYPDVEIRLRLSDRKLDMMADWQDVALFIGVLEDSTLKFRKIAECDRLFCAAPDYLRAHPAPQVPQDLLHGHNCLLLRYPRAPEYFWTVSTPYGPQKLGVSGSFDADDGDVLIGWALAGHGIVNIPRFEAAPHLASGDLVEVLADTPPVPVSFGCLHPHRRYQDPKIRTLWISWSLPASAA